MWMIGAVTKNEAKKLTKMGFDIERMVKPDEFNKMAQPHFVGNVDTEKWNDLALIWFDVNLVDYLREQNDRRVAERACNA